MTQIDFATSIKRYGRAREESKLLHAYRRVCSSVEEDHSQVALISGCSGTGKTSLAETLRDHVLKDKGYFVAGKFDQLQTGEPYSALVAAFSEFCELVVAEGPDQVERTREAIRASVGSESRILTDVIPHIGRLIGNQVVERRRSTIDTHSNNFGFVLRKFTRAISSPEHPVVLFLDDLQWGDKSSIELIATLAADVNNTSILFVLAFRDIELSETHPLTFLLRELEAIKVGITEIKVSNLDQGTVNDLISDTLNMPPKLTGPLTTWLFEKTNGNVFFVVQYLKSLCDDGSLYFDAHDEIWRWDLEEEKKSSSVSDSIAELMVEKLKRLPQRYQDALKVAACIGAVVDEQILDDAITMSTTTEDIFVWADEKGHEETLRQTLDRAVYEGLLVVTPEPGKYKFVHDQIQHAAYSLIPEDTRNQFHLAVGRRLWNGSSGEELEIRKFTIANQFIQGEATNLVASRGERIELAKLNLGAGEKAMLSSAFVSAAVYLNTGIDLLYGGDWNENYDLSYALFNTAAEAEYCNGNFENVERYVQQVLLNAKSFREKLHSLTIRVYALGAQKKLKEAMDTGFAVLRQLGERFPSRAVKLNVMLDIYKTRRMLQHKGNAALLRLPELDNPDRAAAMQLLNMLSIYSYLARSSVTPMVTFRLVQLSIRYGVCAVSPTGFASYGVLLCGFLGEMEEGYRFGQLALALLEKFDAKEWVARVYSQVWGCINSWNRHVRRSLEPLKYAHRVGLETGDIEFSMMNAHYFCIHAFQSGCPLDQVETDFRACCQQMAHYKQVLLLPAALLGWQSILNYMGRSDDPLVLTGEAMDQAEVLKDSREKDHALCIFIAFVRLQLACYFGYYHLAEEMASSSRRMNKLASARFEKCTHSFFDGLTALFLARTSKRRERMALARKNLKKMKKWAQHAPQNCLHRVYLLQAEFAVISRKHYQAVKLYSQAIDQAGKEGFIQEQALSSERAGLYYLERCDEDRAAKHIKSAHKLYKRWGAHAKVKQLDQNYSSLF